ncbi:MAG: S41 family peptidase [Erysipelotrichaceae bacterium]|nr:S41 family peptidase [Erysipelotrichaceae bacterium]MDD3923793.1 S41 family peptidase [Erysipelotrichaceae bacterium]
MGDNKEDRKIQIKLERHLWPDEIEEIRQKKRKKQNTILLAILIVFAISSSLLIGVILGMNTKADEFNTENEQFNRFATIYQTLLEDWYFINDIDDPESTLIDRAIDGMIGTDLDLHTDYMTPEEVEYFAQSIDMGFTGIGIQYQIIDDGILVERIYKDAPADQAGLEPGDIIIEIDGKSVTGWDSDKLVSEVQGEAGTVVNVTYIRQKETFMVDITRAIVENSVYGEIIDYNIGYIQIFQFSSAAPEEVEKYLIYFKDNNVDKLIIDLRDDGGGYLTSLIGVASLFLDEGDPILIQEYTDKTAETSFATGGNYENFTNIIILGNENSASASEAFIGCMRDNGEAIFVGVTTYGKSTVQVPVYFADGSALKYSKALWLTPKRIAIDKVGLEPDVFVELHPVLGMPIIELSEGEFYQYDQVDENIAIAQNCLDFLGYEVERNDGYFDQSTKTALIEFQKDYDLKPSGIMDGDVTSLLCSEVIRQWSTDTDRYDTQKAKALELLNE